MLTPILNQLLIPLALGLAPALIALRMARPGVAAGLLALGIIAGFLGSYGAEVGAPPFPPVSSVQKLFYAPLIGGALLVGAVLVGALLAKALSGRATLLLGLCIAIGQIVWVLSNEFSRLDSEAVLNLALVLAAVGLMAFATLSASDSSVAIRAGHGAFALGLAVVMILGATATTGLYLIALAVALGSSAALEPRLSAHNLGPALSAAAMICVAPIFAQAVFYTDVDPAALAVAPLAFLGVAAVRRLGVPEGRTLLGSIGAGALTALLCLIPIAVSVFLVLQAGGDEYGY